MIETPPLLTSSHILVVKPTWMRGEAAIEGTVLANASSSHNRRQCWRIGCPWCVNHERCRRKNHVDKSTDTHQVQVAVSVAIMAIPGAVPIHLTNKPRSIPPNVSVAH